MAITVQQVLSYLDTHPLCTNKQSFTSLLQILCNIYYEYNPVDTPQMKAMFEQLDTILSKLSFSDNNLIFDTVIRLCIECEKTSFSHGIAVGVRLMAELYDITTSKEKT